MPTVYCFSMQVAAVQFDISWEDPKSSLLSVSAMLAMADLAPGALAVLPETFATGFTLDLSKTLPAQEETERILRDLARSLGIHIAGGLAARTPEGRVENQVVFYAPDGCERGRYAKRHPFTPWGEEKFHAPGRSIVTIPLPEALVAPLICYDLRFPEDFRQAAFRGAEVFVVPANWPGERIAHWRALLVARAIENQAYVVGVNRTGSDPRHTYPGGSLIVSPRGEILAEGGEQPAVLTAELDLADLRAYREEFPALRDRRVEG